MNKTSAFRAVTSLFVVPLTSLVVLGLFWGCGGTEDDAANSSEELSAQMAGTATQGFHDQGGMHGGMAPGQEMMMGGMNMGGGAMGTMPAGPGMMKMMMGCMHGNSAMASGGGHMMGGMHSQGGMPNGNQGQGCVMQGSGEMGGGSMGGPGGMGGSSAGSSGSMSAGGSGSSGSGEMNGSGGHGDQGGHM